VDDAACIQKRNQKKKFTLNDKEYSRLADHIGVFPLVMISPYDRDLINEGSETRRKYIDSVIAQFDKVYLDNLINYNKALQQRNILLKKFAENRTYDRASIEIWDNQIIRLGQKIYEVRKPFIEEFSALFREYFNSVSAGKEETSISYESQLHTRPLEELLAVSIDRDRAVHYTTSGIHKDDLSFSINGFPVKKFGSQGQQKSYVIAIKLAQFEYTRRVKGYKPILLLDDIFDKLDPHRVRQIIELVNEHSFGQVFITDTQKSRIEEIFKEVNTDHKLFLISNGDTKVLPG
jgi:DNA replication and repair protein RecF